MTQLTSKQRLTRLLNKQDIDRVPIWLLNPIDRLGCYADIFNLKCYERLIPYINDVCDNFNRRGFNTGFCFNGNPDIHQGTTDVTVEGEGFSVPCVSYGDKIWTRYSLRTQKGTRRKFYISDPDELKDIMEIPYTPPVMDTSAYEREKAGLGERGLMMIDIGDALCPLYNLMDPQDFSMATATHYPLLLEFTDEMCRRNLAMYKTLLDAGIGDVFFIVGAEFAGPPLVSPQKFDEMSSRYVKQIIDLVRSYGKHSIVHFHGQLLDIRDGFAHIGPDGLHTIEAPPIGNCTLTQAREKLGDMILIGNVQYDDIFRQPRDVVYEMARDAVLEAKSGRFILSPSAGPYDSDVPESMIDNYIALIEAGLRYGSYA